MIDFSDLLRPEAVRTDVSAANKKAVLAAAGAALATIADADPRAVADALAERERLGTTGFGHGVAIPHARLAGRPEIVGVFLRLAQPIAYASVDDEPVDLVFAMLSPPDAGADHLKALARVSRRLRDQPFLAKLRGAGSPDALWSLFVAGDHPGGTA